LLISSTTRGLLLTFNILQASSRSMPVCFVMRFVPDIFEAAPLAPALPAATAPALLAAACRYAWTKARPTTWDPTRMTWAINRWACRVRTDWKIMRIPFVYITMGRAMLTGWGGDGDGDGDGTGTGMAGLRSGERQRNFLGDAAEKI
jgi:hypothetical protein